MTSRRNCGTETIADDNMIGDEQSVVNVEPGADGLSNNKAVVADGLQGEGGT